MTLSIKIAQKPYIIGSLGPKALKYESFDAKGDRTKVGDFMYYVATNGRPPHTRSLGSLGFCRGFEGVSRF